MNPLVLHHHLGMGDHIICNGMVRTLLNKGKFYTDVYLFAKERNANRVIRMFDDEPRIHVISIPSNQNEIQYVNKFIFEKNVMNFMRCGFGAVDNLQLMGITKDFDEALYISAGIPHEKRWSEFRLRRDPVEEGRVLRKLNPNSEKFMFVHDDPSRGIVFSPDNSNGLKIIKNDPSEDIFNMCMLLEHAEEIHCMESSFRCLIEHLPNIKCPLYLHTGVRNDGHGESIVSGVRKKWITV
jgi:hypothetical protein